MPFFRYAKAIFNEQNESEIGNEKSGHFWSDFTLCTSVTGSVSEDRVKNWYPCITIFDEMCTAIFAGTYLSICYKGKCVLLFVNV